MSETKDAVLEKVAAIIREILAEDWADDLDITMASSFGRDLELESIEFVALAERLKETYGGTVDFAGWLASMELERILALRVGDLVEFIAKCASK